MECIGCGDVGKVGRNRDSRRHWNSRIYLELWGWYPPHRNLNTRVLHFGELTPIFFSAGRRTVVQGPAKLPLIYYITCLHFASPRNAIPFRPSTRGQNIAGRPGGAISIGSIIKLPHVERRKAPPAEPLQRYHKPDSGINVRNSSTLLDRIRGKVGG